MKEETKSKIKKISVVLFLIYLIMLVYLLFFAETYGRTIDHPTYHYNLQLFREVRRFWIYQRQLGFGAVFTNIFGNILAFVPFGAILPILSRKCRHFYLVALFSFEFSLMVECIQLITKVGIFDVDDILLNTIGGMLGYFTFAVGNWLRRKYYG